MANKPRHVSHKGCKSRDSHIASLPILQSSFFKGVRFLILASSEKASWIHRIFII